MAGGELLAGRGEQGHLGRERVGGGRVLARVARTLYWTARDLERAETHARVLEA
ncbi:MAG: alpha-E domain-containing protein, partial [Thermoleophilia bacterium]|nr:alpha-E domain-containing protein [Thermoleophilia bacterium]